MTQEEQFLFNESEQKQLNERNRAETERISNGEVWFSKQARIHNCKITKDGNEWCCLWGDDLQIGIVGFGKTPMEAIMDWGYQFGLY